MKGKKMKEEEKKVSGYGNQCDEKRKIGRKKGGRTEKNKKR